MVAAWKGRVISSQVFAESVLDVIGQSSRCIERLSEGDLRFALDSLNAAKKTLEWLQKCELSEEEVT